MQPFRDVVRRETAHAAVHVPSVESGLAAQGSPRKRSLIEGEAGHSCSQGRGGHGEDGKEGGEHVGRPAARV